MWDDVTNSLLVIILILILSSEAKLDAWTIIKYFTHGSYVLSQKWKFLWKFHSQKNRLLKCVTVTTEQKD